MNLRVLLLPVGYIMMMFPAIAQQPDRNPVAWKDFGVTGSFQIENRRSVSVGFGKIGFIRFFNMHGGIIPDPFGYTFENEFVIEDEFLYAPKLGVHLNLVLFYVGASMAFYTNFHDRSCLTINPELGIGLLAAFVLWNPTITIADFGENITQHNLTVKVLLPLDAF